MIVTVMTEAAMALALVFLTLTALTPMSATTAMTRGGRITANLLSLLIPLSASATAGYKNAADLRQNKVLHDYAFNVALESLRDQGFLLENGLDSMSETGFVLLEGPVRIFDYETFSNIAENFDKLDESFNSNLSKNELKKRRESSGHRRFVQSKILIDTFFKDAIRVRLTDSEGQGFIGPLSRERLRENMRNLIFKHGSEPEDDWVMLAEISRLPLRGGSPGVRLQELLGGGQPGQGQQRNPSEMINSVVDVFDAFQELIGSASHLDVAVSPIAVYREVHPGM
jgi:hypothetical protein